MNVHSAPPSVHRPGMRALAVVFAVVARLLGAHFVSEPVTAEGVTVRAVLFYSPTCPHCHQVLVEDLPPVRDRFGEQLELLLVDVSAPAGASLYEAAIVHFNVPNDRIGVPTMIVEDAVLVGSVEIPEQFPLYVERLLAEGGADWPPITGLAGFLPASIEASRGPADLPPEAIASATAGTAAAVSVVDLVGRDPIGNTLAIVVLIGLLGSLAWAAAAILRARARSIPGRPAGWIPLLALAGLSVAGYLSGVELTESSAVCGPVGDCNLVHTSIHARLFGIPVGLLGVAGYAFILGSWVLARRSGGRLMSVARVGLVAVAATGTLFSVYLTFLEPFVLGATCAWCLASAVLMDAILIMSTTSLVQRAPIR